MGEWVGRQCTREFILRYSNALSHSIYIRGEGRGKDCNSNFILDMILFNETVKHML